jgi:gamma-butyrobetaine dioxygenase
VADFAATLASPSALHAALAAFSDTGFLLLRGAGTAGGAAEAWAAHVGYPRATHYGPSFSVRAERAPISFAYTPEALPFHTDLPYRSEPPGVQLLHCRANSAAGGESTLLDGFKAAGDLAAEDPAAFAALAATPVTWTWQGKGGMFLSSVKPIIALAAGEGEGAGAAGEGAAAAGEGGSADAGGSGGGTRAPAISAIHWDNRNMSLSFAYTRASAARGGGASHGAALLSAYAAFSRHINRPANALRLKLAPGDILVFNNRRCLHGREAFDPRTGSRLLEGT